MMAGVAAIYHYADGDEVSVSVEIENDYPDALREAVRTCADMLREAMVAGIVVQAEDDDD